tara:strand:+ start:10394 stop:12568 length:2175 start_codon:yes stop_codon:yes gene_type:complete
VYSSIVNRISNTIDWRTIEMSDSSLYRTWDSDSQRQEAYKSTADNIEAYDGIQKAVAYGRRTSYIDIEPNRSVRTSFLREDYDNFRPGESVSNRQKRIIKMSMQAYDKVGIIRNVIDLMSDFAAQGLTLVHPNKTIEKFYRKWFVQVNGADRSERFLNYLYRCGNVVVQRRTAKINRQKEQELKRSGGADLQLSDIKVPRREVPWVYDFLNPLAVEVADYGTHTIGKPQYNLNLSKYTSESLVNSSTTNKSVFKTLPIDLQKRLGQGERKIPLDSDKVGFYYYKKDDWLMWANPMIYAILDDIMMLEKMKLADLAALDGAISNVRLWTVGDLDHKIIPTKAAINKLRDILASNVGGGTMDLVWGPELKFSESQSQVYRFLGAEKYQPVLTSIYAGLGIPPTLTGASTSGGYTNNYVSLKTLIERLEYGREILCQFWRHEIEMIRKAMGFRFPAEIHFDSIVLSDEAAEKQLLIQLADRDIISQETLLERFRELPSIERVRVRREERERNNDVSAPKKAGPYHNPQHVNDVAKISLTKDILDSDEYLEKLGLPPSPAEEPQTPEIDQKSEPDNSEQYDPEEPNGRPRFSKDQTKRKKKRVLPRSGDATTATLWAMDAQSQISDVLSPIALAHFNKKNARSLNKAEVDQLEYLKMCVLTSMTPYMEITPEIVKQLLDMGTKPSEEFNSVVAAKTDSFVYANNRRPNTSEMRYIYASTFADVFDFSE